MRLSKSIFAAAGKKPTPIARCALVFLVAATWPLAVATRSVVADTSELWGERGEKWTAQSRLPDFSFAGYDYGYGCGEVPIPQVAVVASGKDFGATRSGATDDTAAFIRAMNDTPKGTISIPAGRYC